MLGRIMKAAAAPVRIVDAYLSAITRTHADARLRVDARGRLAAFAKSWRRE